MPSRLTARRWRAGFTLVEVLLAFTIAILLLSTVPVAFDRLYRSVQYRNTVQEVLSYLRLARERAQATGRPAVFALHGRERSFDVTGQPPKALPAGIDARLIVAASDADPDGGVIRFYPDGGSSGGSVELLRPAGDGVRLRVDWLFGRISQEALLQ